MAEKEENVILKTVYTFLFDKIREPHSISYKMLGTENSMGV